MDEGFFKESVGITCPHCKKVFSSQRDVLIMPPVRFRCHSCGLDFGIEVPVSSSDIMARSYPIVAKAAEVHPVKEEFPKPPKEADAEPEPYLGFNLKWKLALLNFDDEAPKAEFFREGWQKGALGDVAAKFQTVVDTLPFDEPSRKYLQQTIAAAEVPLVRAGSLEWLKPLPQSFVLFLALLAGLVLPIGLVPGFGRVSLFAFVLFAVIWTYQILAKSRVG